MINYYTEATRYDKERYKAWHAFAYANYEAVLFYKQQKMSPETESSDGTTKQATEELRDVSLWSGSRWRNKYVKYKRSLSFSR